MFVHLWLKGCLFTFPLCRNHFSPHTILLFLFLNLISHLRCFSPSVHITVPRTLNKVRLHLSSVLQNTSHKRRTFNNIYPFRYVWVHMSSLLSLVPIKGALLLCILIPVRPGWLHSGFAWGGVIPTGSTRRWKRREKSFLFFISHNYLNCISSPLSTEMLMWDRVWIFCGACT